MKGGGNDTRWLSRGGWAEGRGHQRLRGQKARVLAQERMRIWRRDSSSVRASSWLQGTTGELSGLNPVAKWTCLVKLPGEKTSLDKSEVPRFRG